MAWYGACVWIEVIEISPIKFVKGPVNNADKEINIAHAEVRAGKILIPEYSLDHIQRCFHTAGLLGR